MYFQDEETEDTSPYFQDDQELLGGPPVYTPGTRRQALLMSVAQAPTALSNQELFEYAMGQSQRVEEAIASGKEKGERDLLAAQSLTNSARMYGQAVAEADAIDPTLGDAARELMYQEINEKREKNAKIAAEKEFLNRIELAAMKGESERARLLGRYAENGPAEQVLRDGLMRDLIISSRLDRFSDAADDQGLLRSAWESTITFLGSFTFDEGRSTDNVKKAGVDEDLFDWILPGRRGRDEAFALARMPLDELPDYLDNVLVPNIVNNSDYFGIMNNKEAAKIVSDLMLPGSSDFIRNLGPAIDAASFIPFTKIGKLGSLPAILARGGARTEGSELLAKMMIDAPTPEAGKEILTSLGTNVDEVAQAALPAVVRTEQSDLLPLASEAASRLEETDLLVERIVGNIPQSGRQMTPEELQIIIDKNKTELSRQFKNSLIDIEDPDLATLSTGQQIRTFSLRLGSGDGKMFKTKKEADAMRKSLGLGDAEVLQDASGKWYLQLQRDMMESGFVQIGADPLSKTSLGAYLRSTAHAGDRALGAVGLGTSIRSTVLRTLQQEFGDTFNVLTRPEREVVSSLMRYSDIKGTWLTESQLYEKTWAAVKRDPTKREIAAYEGYQRISDIEWRLRNDEMYVALARKGYRDVGLDTGKTIRAMVDRALEGTAPRTVYNISENIVHTRRANVLTPQALKKYRDEGYVLLRPEKAYETLSGTFAHGILVKASEMSDNALGREVMPYRAGGHRIYSDKWFAKQSAIGKTDDGDVLLQPNTLAVGTEGEMNLWVRAMNEAMTAVRVRTQVSADDIDEIFSRYNGIRETGEEFLRKVASKDIDVNNPFEVVYDRQLPKDYYLSKDNYGWDDIHDGFEAFANTHGRLYYSGKGAPLVNYQNELADILDPFETVNKAINNVANVVGFADYKITAIERWAKAFGPNVRGGEGMSPYQLFREGTLDRNDPKFVASELQRKIIQRTLGWQTDTDLTMRTLRTRFAAFAMGEDPTTFRHRAGKWTGQWWGDKNPLRALKEFAFDMSMGFFNPTQIFLQSVSTLNTAAIIGPRLAYAALNGAETLTFSLMRGKSFAKTVDDLAKNPRIVRLFGGSPEDFKFFMNSAKKSGWFEVATSHALVNDMGPDVLSTGMAKSYTKVKELGRAPFNLGESFNRSYAYRAAWLEMQEKHPDLFAMARSGKDGHFFLNKVMQRADDLTLNMSEQSKAGWQHGIVSVPTQFWSYQARSIEALVGRTLTNKEKARLLVSQTFFWGSSATPPTVVISQYLQHKDGQAPEPGTVGQLLDQGFVDWALYNMTGADLSFSTKFGTGGWLPQLVEEVFGMSEYGDKSMFEWATGVSFSKTGSIIYDGLNLLRMYSLSEMGDDNITAETLKGDAALRLASNLSTASVAQRSYLLYKYGQWRSRTGSTIVDPAQIKAPTTEAILTALFGVDSGKRGDISAISAYEKNEKKMVKDASKIVRDYRTRMLNEPDKAQELGEEINLYISQFPPSVRKKILKEANYKVNRSVYESYANRLQKRLDEKEQGERLNGPSD
jgi:hypothetical protein